MSQNCSPDVCIVVPRIKKKYWNWNRNSNQGDIEYCNIFWFAGYFLGYYCYFCATLTLLCTSIKLIFHKFHIDGQRKKNLTNGRLLCVLEKICVELSFEVYSLSQNWNNICMWIVVWCLSPININQHTAQPLYKYYAIQRLEQHIHVIRWWIDDDDVLNSPIYAFKLQIWMHMNCTNNKFELIYVP